MKSRPLYIRKAWTALIGYRGPEKTQLNDKCAHANAAQTLSLIQYSVHFRNFSGFYIHRITANAVIIKSKKMSLVLRQALNSRAKIVQKIDLAKEKRTFFLFWAWDFYTKRRQYKIKVQKTFIFIVEMQPILSKDSAKNRFSEGKENIFSFLSVRFLFKKSI